MIVWKQRVGEQARIWLSVKASGIWHSLKHVLGVAAEDVEVSCTKSENGGLHKAVCQ